MPQAAAAAERRALAVCAVLATGGELFLEDVSGLYEYRLDNLPLFIPAGHALVYAAASRMSLRAPHWLPGGTGAARRTSSRRGRVSPCGGRRGALL